MAQPNDNKLCKKCEESNNPLVPSLSGQDELCSRCMLLTQIEKLDEVQDDFRVEMIKIESDELSRQFEGKPPNKTTRDLEKVQQKACGAIKLMMSRHVPKKGSEEVGKFEPTYGDVQVMEALAPDVCLQLRKGSLCQFHSILHPNDKQNFEGTLFEVFDSKKTNKNEYSDQNKRAKKLVEEMRTRNSKTVFLLDGHGRMLLSIIHAMIKQKLDPDSFKFVVVDNDKECQCFHEHFFPKSVTCEYMDILDIQLCETDMLYMNFCSIPSRLENILFNKEEVLKWLWECMNTMKCGIMISAVIRDTRTEEQRRNEKITGVGPRKGKNTKEYHLLPVGFQQFLEDKALFGADVVSRRQNFVTWLIPKKCTTKKRIQQTTTTSLQLEDFFEDQGIIWNRNIEFSPGTFVNVKCDTSLETMYKITKRTPDNVDLVEFDPCKSEDSLKEGRVNIKDISIADDDDVKRLKEVSEMEENDRGQDSDVSTEDSDSLFDPQLGPPSKSS